jgi:geranylgeranyl pyrophosphate synthase
MDREIREYLESKKQVVDSIIKKYIPEKISEGFLEWFLGKAKYSHDLEALNRSFAEPVWDFLGRGGKRWRPALFFLITEALGGDVEKVKEFSIVPELTHNGSIITDDIEDSGEIRRGKPCLHRIFGLDTAINAGNFLYFLPLMVFQKNAGRFDDRTLLRAYRVYAEEMVNIHFGQGTDIFWHRGGKREISESQYLQMVAFKTGCLARQAGRLAVVLSGGSEELEKKIGGVCESIGIAFQIADDTLSIAGGEFQKGKGFGDDITEGKRSLPVIHALRQAPASERERLLEILDMHTRDENLIREAMDIIRKHGSVEYSRGVARKIVTSAWQEAEPLLKPSPSKALLKKFISFAIERQI